MLELFGARILPLPGLTHPHRWQADIGFLVPDVASRLNGLELLGRQLLLRLADNRDLTLGAYVSPTSPPMVSAQVAAADRQGRLPGHRLCHLQRLATDGHRCRQLPESDPRGYLDANGRFQFSPELEPDRFDPPRSDRTFLRRYDISRDDRLRSTVNSSGSTDRQLPLDRRLGDADAAGQCRSGAGAAGAARDRLPPPASPIRCSAGG
jgi:LPS-assembly protein